MPAPKGNQFWKARTTYGRLKDFPTPELLWNACVEYFEWVDANPLYETKAWHSNGEVTTEALPKMRAMTLKGLCRFIDITYPTWMQYRKNKEYSNIVETVEEIVREQKFTGAAADLLNANIIARDLGLAEKSQQDVVVKYDEMDDSELDERIRALTNGQSAED